MGVSTVSPKSRSRMIVVSKSTASSGTSHVREAVLVASVVAVASSPGSKVPLASVSIQPPA
jgi:hypothetical protein